MAKDFDKEDGVWRTIGGRRVFIRNGQSLSDAMIESGKFSKKGKMRESYRNTKNELQEERKEAKGEEKRLKYEGNLLEKQYFNAKTDDDRRYIGENLNNAKAWAKEQKDKVENYDAMLDKENTKTKQLEKSKQFDKEHGKAEPLREQYKQDKEMDKKNERIARDLEYVSRVAEEMGDKKLAETNKLASNYAKSQIKNKSAEDYLKDKSTSVIQKSDPYDDPESEESQRLQDIQRRYDEYLQDTENRGASYGEIAYVDSLRGKALDDFEKELDNYDEEKYNKENNDWLSQKDKEWLNEQGHNKKLENKIKNFKPSGDVEKDENRLNDISSNYFYDEAGIYNENIDSTATKWAHDKAVELNNKAKDEENEKKEHQRLQSWRINKEGKVELYEHKLTDDERGYWTIEDGRRVFKENPNYKDPSTKERQQRLNNLLKQKDDLYNDDTISDDEYYRLVEKIDNQIANEYSAEEIDRAENQSKNDWLPKHTEIKEQGTSNRKEVSDNIQAHILEYYSPDYTGDDIPAEEAFVRQMDAMGESNKWKAGQRIAEGGSYLIYNGDMAEFLDSLKINPKGKSFNDDKAFDMYVSLVGRESAKLYDKIKKHQETNSKDWVRKAFEDYKKQHPNTKKKIDDFRK